MSTRRAVRDAVMEACGLTAVILTATAGLALVGLTYWGLRAAGLPWLGVLAAAPALVLALTATLLVQNWALTWR